MALQDSGASSQLAFSAIQQMILVEMVLSTEVTRLAHRLWLESSSQPGRVSCQPSCSYLADLLECCGSPTSSKWMVQISGNIPHQKLTQSPSLSRLMPMVRLPRWPLTILNPRNGRSTFESR